MRILDRQHGKGMRGRKDPWLNDWASGPETLPESVLESNRVDYIGEIRQHGLDDGFFHSRTPDFAKIRVPLLSAANWGGLGLHSRGNFEGFLQSASPQKWLEVHVGMHEEYFYMPYGFDLQKRFFDHFLKGVDNGWEKEPPVLLTIRYVDHFAQRKENEWPLARTKWARVYLNSWGRMLNWGPPERPGKQSFAADGPGITFASAPLVEQTELTGPISCRLYVSSSTTDADLFLTLRAFDLGGKELDFRGAMDSHTPLSQGWLRASHRKLDQLRSKPYRPYHSHDEVQKLRPGAVYELDVELWPTCAVLPRGYRIALTVQGRDFERPDSTERWKGSGPFLHNDPVDRPESEFKGTTELHTGANEVSHLLLPLIP
jgi:predicted acyl esterase